MGNPTMNAYYVCAGMVKAVHHESDGYTLYEAEAGTRIVIAGTRGQARAMVSSLFDLEFTAPMQIMKLTHNTGRLSPKILSDDYDGFTDPLWLLVDWSRTKSPEDIADYCKSGFFT